MKQKLFSRNSSSSSKGQAALEFLTTYGWMFMIVLVVFGGLVYFGFTDGKDKIPTSCRFNGLVECKAFYAHEDGRYAVEIKNVDSKPVNITHFICGYPYKEEVVSYRYTDDAFDPGDSRVYYCDNVELLEPLIISGKELFKMKIAYTYIEVDPIPIVINGELVAEASDDDVLRSDYETAWSALNHDGGTRIFA